MSGLVVRAGLAGRDVKLDLEVGPGEVVAVLGPNGAGKSTLLSLVAGLLAPTRGRITLDGTVLADAAAGTHVPPHRRGVVLLAQQALLFPHLTARENVAFGPRSRGGGRAAARVAADRWLAAVDATGLADRRPAQLSGGQAQRVAVARALAADPRLLLLDEPMAALDVTAAPALRQLLRTVLRTPGQARAALLVTHDVLDALVLSDRVVVVEAGRVVEAGPTRDVLARPRSAFAARVSGLNLLAGTVEAQGVRLPGGGLVAGVLGPGCAPGTPAVAVFGPRAVAVHLGRPGGSPRNAVEVEIASVEPRGDLVRVRAADGPTGAGLLADVTAASAAELELVPGGRAWFAVKATEVAVHPS
ncbi:ATP-binding cassette domain-containing protein [Rhodococcus aerolatus]